MITELLTAAFEAVAASATTARPLLGAYVGNRFRRDFEDKTNAWQAAANTGGTGDDVRFIERVLAEAGHPAGMVSADDCRAVPTAHLNQLVAATIELSVVKQQLDSLVEASKQGKA